MAGKPPNPRRQLPPGLEDPETTSITSLSDLQRELGNNSGPRTAYLIVLQGSDVGEMFKIDSPEVVIGRGQAATLRLNDDGVSRRHARIVRVGDALVIEDLQSANGTIVNGEKITQHELVDGDKIRFGSTTILKFTHQDDIDQNFQQRMYDAAIRDSLTKVYNKAHFLDRLEKEFAYAKRHDSALSLVMFDLDFFKKVNDNYGHLAGDHALIAVTEICNQLIRSEDLLARYGGEEFAIICRGVSVLAGGIMCERIRSTIASTEVMFDNQRLPITVSIGVSGLIESHAASGLELVALADKALYEAKQKGRNRVQISRGPSERGSSSG